MPFVETEVPPSGPSAFQLLTLWQVFIEGMRAARSGVAALVPLAGLLIAVGTGFLYLVGIHTYDLYRDVYGIPIHLIDPSLNDILARGAQASIFSGSALFLLLFFVLAGLYVFFAWVSVMAANSAIRLYRLVATDPASVDQGSRRERVMRRRILSNIERGEVPNSDVAKVQAVNMALLFTFFFGMMFCVPGILVGAQFIGYPAIGNDRFIGWLMLPESWATKYLYKTDKSIICGVVLVEGAKGVVINLENANSVEIVRPENIRNISRVSKCP